MWWILINIYIHHYVYIIISDEFKTSCIFFNENKQLHIKNELNNIRQWFIHFIIKSFQSFKIIKYVAKLNYKLQQLKSLISLFCEYACHVITNMDILKLYGKALQVVHVRDIRKK